MDIALSETIKLDNQLISIEYPGLVQNENEALKTMGGLHTISVVQAQGNRKIELRFRPDDPFCKPAHGERIPTANILLRVTRTTRRNKRTQEASVSCSMKVVGVIRTTYKFMGLCDFQYLPMEPVDNIKDNSGDTFTSLIDRVVPQGLVNLEWIEGSGPIFMSPPLFSRLDIPVEYNFRNESGPTTLTNSNVIGRLRKRRSLQAIFVNFEEPHVPSRPRDMALRNMTVRFIKQDDADTVRNLFLERPVWTKAALSYHAQQVEHNSMKCIIAASAYYFTTGPWRNCWVRFGHDPRQEPQDSKYQILDYRIMHTLRSRVTPKRSYSGYAPHKFGSSYRTKPSSIRQQQEAGSASQERTEGSFAFRPGFIPKCRQMFYQLCDLHVPEIEAILQTAQLNETCTERHGWLPANVEDDCRRILSKYISSAFDRDKSKGKKDRADAAAGEDLLEEDEEEVDDEEEEAPVDPETNLQDSSDESSSEIEYQPGMDIA